MKHAVPSKMELTACKNARQVMQVSTNSLEGILRIQFFRNSSYFSKIIFLRFILGQEPKVPLF